MGARFFHIGYRTMLPTLDFGSGLSRLRNCTNNSRQPNDFPIAWLPRLTLIKATEQVHHGCKNTQ
jgi:hypothetical protein